MKKLILSGLAFLVIIFSPLAASAARVYVSYPAISFEVSWEPYVYGEVWIDGYWTRNRYGERVWVDGYWKRKPRPRAVWVNGYWKRRHGHWVWVDGYWEKKHRPRYDMKVRKWKRKLRHRRYDPWQWEYGVGYRWY